MQSNQETQKDNNEFVINTSEKENNNSIVVDEKTSIPVAVTLQPLVKVKKDTVELAQVNIPSINKIVPEQEKELKNSIEPLKTFPKKIQVVEPVLIQKKAPPIHRKVRKTKVKKSTKLTVKETRQLVNNLQMYMEENNHAKVESLLGDLQKSSGENSLVYLRMHAYWSSLQKDDDSAVRMYKKILFQKPNDLQAGTNLALIEARQDNIVDAVERLRALQKHYPSDKNIQNYIKRIEVMK